MVRLPDGHLVRIPHGRRPSQKRTPLYHSGSDLGVHVQKWNVLDLLNWSGTSCFLTFWFKIDVPTYKRRLCTFWIKAWKGSILLKDSKFFSTRKRNRKSGPRVKTLNDRVQDLRSKPITIILPSIVFFENSLKIWFSSIATIQ